MPGPLNQRTDHAASPSPCEGKRPADSPTAISEGRSPDLMEPRWDPCARRSPREPSTEPHRWPSAWPLTAPRGSRGADDSFSPKVVAAPPRQHVKPLTPPPENRSRDVLGGPQQVNSQRESRAPLSVVRVRMPGLGRLGSTHGNKEPGTRSADPGWHGAAQLGCRAIKRRALETLPHRHGPDPVRLHFRHPPPFTAQGQEA